jgi:TolB-like protein
VSKARKQTAGADLDAGKSAPDNDRKTDGLTTASFSRPAIEQQLKRILDSPDFDATNQQRAFLNFIISETLDGNSRDIKGYTVATQVFGRDENFDQAIDPIVSIQANKLRRSLERYYLLTGNMDPVYIEIPKGTYVPVFSKRETDSTPFPAHGREQVTDAEDSWPTLLIKPFHNLAENPDRDFWGAGFAAELAMEINRFQWVRVLRFSPEGQERRSTDSGARFIIEGNIREYQDCIKIDAFLTDSRTNTQIWAGTQKLSGDLSQIIEFQERTATEIGTRIAGEQGVLFKTLAAESKNKPPEQLKTYEAILRYHEYDQSLSPDIFARALEALEHAKIIEPDCGQVWTLLARLYANIYSLEIPGFAVADTEQKALRFAEKGARLNPGYQGGKAILALVRMLSGDLESARRDIDLAYRLYPDSLYFMDGIGYIKTLLGDWEEGPRLIRKVIRHNPYYKNVVHYPLWVDYLRQGDLRRAYLETTQLMMPSVFWYPLAKASTLGLLGRIEEGSVYAGDLLQLKPEFRERGRVLIGRYIKFAEISDLVVEGLAKVGIHVE